MANLVGRISEPLMSAPPMLLGGGRGPDASPYGGPLPASAEILCRDWSPDTNCTLDIDPGLQFLPRDPARPMGREGHLLTNGVA